MYQWDLNNQPFEVTEQLGPGYSIEKTFDGGFVISTGSYIIKTDSEFNFDESLFTEESINQAPGKFRLNQNYPNPFNSFTTLSYYLSEYMFVDFSIYDISGKKIKTFIKEDQGPGEKIIKWDGKNDLGNLAVSGLYIYSLKTDKFDLNRKMILIK